MEAQISRAVQNPELRSRPEHVFMGVLAGRTLPSPIQQRRSSSSLLRVDAQIVALSASKRRELLQQERPARSAVSRERLAMEYFRSGHLSFACSINNDVRGLKLDLHYISVFPSPDCYDRSACLFSYLYEHVDTCEVVGTRLELRFRRSSTKQPTHITLQSLEVHYIREAIWYLQHGAYLDVCLRARAAASFAANFSNKERQSSSTSSPAPRRGPLAYFEDANVIQQRIDTRCRMMGCQRHAETVGTVHESDVSSSSMLSRNSLSHPSRGVSSTRAEYADRLCDEHIASLTVPRSPSKRGTLFPRERSKPELSLTFSPHYVRMLKYQSPLLKKSGAKKSLLVKSWNLKFVAVFETPVGGFLCYYDRLAHCPGIAESPRERRVIDLSSVICIRPESAATTSSTPLAFDVVTIYRVWTFAATEPEEYETWLKVLADAVEKQTSMAPDKRLKFPVRMMTTAQTPQHHQLTRHEATSLEISPYGVCVCSGHEGETEIYSWYFTEIQRWSVVYQQSEACCLLNCQSGKSVDGTATADALPYHEFLLQTPDAAAICQAIEFYVGKCMAKLEVLAISGQESTTRVRRGLSDSTLPIGVPELVRKKSEQLVKSSPSEVEPIKDRKRGLLPPKQHLIAGVPLKPVGMTESDIAAAAAVADVAPAVALSPAEPTRLSSHPDSAPLQAIRESRARPFATTAETRSSVHDGKHQCQEEERPRVQDPDRSFSGGFKVNRLAPRETHLLVPQQETTTPDLTPVCLSTQVMEAANTRVDDASVALDGTSTSSRTDLSVSGVGWEQPRAPVNAEPANVVSATLDDRPSALSLATEDDESRDIDVPAELELDALPQAQDDELLSSLSLVPIIDLSPVPLLESTEFLRSDRCDSSFSSGTPDDTGDNDSDKFESFGYLECDVFEALASCDSSASSSHSQVFSNTVDEVLRLDEDQCENRPLSTEEDARRTPLPDDGDF